MSVDDIFKRVVIAGVVYLIASDLVSWLLPDRDSQRWNRAMDDYEAQA